jgi:membrane fusion protein, heavy metal efflux system
MTGRILSGLLFCIMLSLAACGNHEDAGVSTTEANSSSPNVLQLPEGVEDRIRTAEVTLEPAQSGLTLSGKVAYGEDRYSRISSALQGRVLRVHVKLGDRVKMRDVLATIESPEIASAYSEFVKEHSDLSYAKRAFELARDLYAIKALAQKDLKQAENDFIKAQAEYRRAGERLLALQVPPEELKKPIEQQTITSQYQIRSPIAGTVVERMITPGQSVGGDANQVLFVVAELTQVQVVADVYEKDLGLFKVGQSATVIVEAYPGVIFSAVVSSIGDVVDPISRTIKVRALVNNEDLRLKPEMFARLNVKLEEGLPFPLIPQDSVLEIDGKMYVYVIQDNKPIKREVKTGSLSGEKIAIVEGLALGERIVTHGAVLLKGEDMKSEESGPAEHTLIFPASMLHT